MSTTETTSIHPQLKDNDSEQAGQIQEQIQDLMSILPREKWYGSNPYIYNYKGCWLVPNMLAGLIEWQNHHQAQENDVLLVTVPKSGTTWLKALMFALVNRQNYPIKNQNHPLLNHNPHALVPFMELSNQIDAREVPDLCSSSSIRLFATHSPLGLLPQPILLNSGCKIIYLCRNPKDVLVSQWHFLQNFSAGTSLEEVFEMFYKGISLCGPIWDHILDYWKESLEKPDKVIFLRYEDMKEEPALQLKRMAECAGCPISAEEEQHGLVDEILRLCNFNNLSNLEVNKKGKWFLVDNHYFFRKGEVGDWKNYLTNEMAQRFDQLTAQKFHGSGLKL